MTARPRVVLVDRRPELDELVDRHSTRGQAEFFLRTRGRSLADVQSAHDAEMAARHQVIAAVPPQWTVAEVDREDLSRFLFLPGDHVVVVGRDGLVANVAKYLDGQPVIGIAPGGGLPPGALVRCALRQGIDLVRSLEAGSALAVDELTMVRADLDDGQSLIALNEVYIGHASHQSARYALAVGERSEEQSSSGLIVATGAGSTGWAASLAHDRGGRRLPAPTDDALSWFVREAWPSRWTGVELTDGTLEDGADLHVRVQSDQLVAFGDGIESDRLVASWGQELTVGIADRHLALAGPPSASRG